MKRITRHKPAALNLPTLRLEGGLFLPDVLEKAALGTGRQQSDADYGIPKGLKQKDEYSRSFQIASALWRHFQAQMDRADIDAGHSTSHFVTDLLRTALAYPVVGASPGITVEDRQFPITHMAGNGQGTQLPIVIAPHTLGLDEPEARFGIRHTDGSNSGTRKKSAFQLLQELLNASPDYRWGLVTNGRTIRLVRDAATLTRPSYLDIDLADLLGGQRYSEFTYAWRLLHASRAGLLPGAESGAQAGTVWEVWREAGQEEGTRVRKGLRLGVTQALLSFGNGFLQHPANDPLRIALQTGKLKKEEFFAELLRLIYRLIFVFSVEERGLLPVNAAYVHGYALSRLRDLSLRRRARTRFGDLWQSIRIVFRGLSVGEQQLGLPALGGLFESTQCPFLDAAELTNSHLLEAMQSLRWALQPGGTLAPIDYRNMDVEELGSVYESLLELVPAVDLPARNFGFVGITSSGNTAGNERKLSGSFYTSDDLVQELIKSALTPLIEAKVKENQTDPEKALLSIKVCDPACGSGHFLLAAARKIAEKLAYLRSHDGAISPSSYRHALREVISHCVYGVDRNPMAIELCKVALWLEAMEPGRPLTFLDAHLRCGDALIGVHDLSVLKQGIPDEAFSPLKDVLAESTQSGNWADDKEGAKELRKRNAAERVAPLLPLAGLNLTIPEDLKAVISIMSADEDDLTDVAEKRRAYEDARADGTLTWRLIRACDIWTAAFFSVKRQIDQPGRDPTPTSDTLWRFLSDPNSLMPHVAEEVDLLQKEHKFFHWPLEFPEVFQEGGFTLLLGNPPWETMSPDVKEYFAKHEPQIASLNPSQQKSKIASLLEDLSIREDWERHARALYAAVRFMKESGRYRLYAEGNLGKGDFNVYRQFVELALTFTAKGGCAAQIVPENLYNGANASGLRKELFKSFRVTTLFGFENTREVWFKDVDNRMKFVLYTGFRDEAGTREVPVCFALNSVAALQDVSNQTLMLPIGLVNEFSPDALTVMEFSNQLEINIAQKMYGKFPRLGQELDGLPMWRPIAELHMGSDSELFSEDPSGLPLFQGSMVTHHDYRAKGYVSGHGRNVLWRELAFGTTEKKIHPQWRVMPEEIPAKISKRVSSYRIGFCDVGRSTDQRSLMAALIPPQTVCGHKVPTIEFEPYSPEVMLLWLAVANSLCMDFIVRMKISLTMSMSILATLPFPRRVSKDDSTAQATALAVRLSCVGPEMDQFRREISSRAVMAGLDLSPCEDPDERANLKAQLDVVVARDLFGLNRDEALYLLDPKNVLGENCRVETFAALRRAEEREFGEYRTQRLVLKAWDNNVARGVQ